MPYQRQTLTQLINQAVQDIITNLPGSDPLLRFSSLRIIATILGGMTNLQFGYLDYIALQAVPFTSTGEFLAAWGALKGVYQEAPTSASGTVTFADPGAVGIPANTIIVRGDGVEATTTAAGTISGGYVTVPATVNADPTGQTGAFGNSATGTVWTLGTSITGISSTSYSSTAFIGGTDLETTAHFLTRILQAYQNGPQIGTSANYVQWALDSSSAVTRAWCWPNGMGSGTVVVYFMEDIIEAGNGGFPVGTNGVATGETRDVAATGDQLVLANYLWTIETNTALVYACGPTPAPQEFTISGLGTPPAPALVTAIGNSISGVFQLSASPNTSDGPVDLSAINSAIAAVPGTSGFVITAINGSAPGNIRPPQGSLAVLVGFVWT